MSETVKKRIDKTKPKSRLAAAKPTGRTLKKNPVGSGEVPNPPKVASRKRTTKLRAQTLSVQVPETVVEASSLMTVHDGQPPVVLPESALQTAAEVTAELFPPLVEDIVTLKTAPQPVEAACLLTSAVEDENRVEPGAYQEQIEQSPKVNDTLFVAEDVGFNPEMKIREPGPTPWTKFLTLVLQAWQWTQTRFKSHQVKKRLRVCESVSLGEKRFIAVIQVDGEQFLVGGSSNSVSTLAHLDKPKEFPDIFRGYEQDLSRA